MRIQKSHHIQRPLCHDRLWLLIGLVLTGSLVWEFSLNAGAATTTTYPTSEAAMVLSQSVPGFGSLDTTFDTDGKLLIDFGGSTIESCATAVAVQPDGKIVVAGEVGGRLVVQDGIISRNVTSVMDFAVVRLNSDGSLDTSFGNGGRVATDISLGDAAFAIALQSDGKIVVAGTSNTGSSTQSDVALVRYNTNGSLDTSFGVSGKVTTDLGGAERAYGVAIQADQKIIVTGPIVGFSALRYNTDGSLDTTFGTGGKAMVPGETAYAVAIQLNQKIVLVGRGSCDFLAARFNSDGSPDSSFGTNGRVTTDLGLNFCDEAHSVAIQADGKIVVAGDLTAKQFGIVRYSANGELDTTFGNEGRVLTIFNNREAIATSVVVEANGTIIAAGGIGPIFEPPNQPPATWGLAGYTSEGSLHPSFGTGGLVTTVMSDSTNRRDGGSAMGAALQTAGKLVVVGSAFNSKGVFGVARYLTTHPMGLVLLTEEGSDHAIALDSVTMMRSPFPVSTVHNFSSDQRTRLMFFALNLKLQPGEGASAVSAQAEDAQKNLWPMTVEYLGEVPGFDWLTQVNVRLPAELANAGDVLVSISLAGLVSNKVRVSIATSATANMNSHLRYRPPLTAHQTRGFHTPSIHVGVLPF